MHDYVTPRELAKVLGLKYATVMARIAKGKIQAIQRSRCYFIHQDEVMRLRGEMTDAQDSKEAPSS